MISVIAGIVLAGFVAFGLTEFGPEPSPHVASAMHDVGVVKEYEPRVISDTEVYEVLEDYGNMVYVIPGSYKVPRIHTVYKNTYEPYCSSDSRIASSSKPFGYDCQNYSSDAAESMAGYTFGVAYSYGTEEEEGHMINVGIVENYDGELKILFYEPNGCYITVPPERMRVILIGLTGIRVTEEGMTWSE